MSDDNVRRYQEGLEAFGIAKRKAFLHEIIGRIRGRPTELLSFADIRARLRLNIENYRGIQDVPLDRIVGSVGRSHEFTRHFLPKRAKTEERWSRVYAQVIGLEGLPPIELYKVDGAYFVRDGNHRVSVARQLGAKTIQAEVIELPTPIGFHPDLTAEEMDATVCYADFLNQMRESFPNLPAGVFRLTHPTAYNDLIGHIHLYRSVESETASEELSLSEAAARWYECVYTPVIEIIRKYQILPQLFPHCTETDLYLWVTEHLRECEEELVRLPEPQPLHEFLVKYLQAHNIPIPEEAVEYQRSES